MRCAFFLAFLGSWSAVLAATPPVPSFRQTILDTNISIGYGIAIADVNGDGKPDVLLADKGAFVWYENPRWQKHILTEKLTPKDHVCIAARDIDGDGKCEIAVGAEWNPGDTKNSGAVFYLVPPADRTQPWKPVKLQHEPTVHRIRWVKNREGTCDLVMLPLHGRGNTASGDGAGVKVLRYKVPSDPSASWTVEPIPTSLHKTHNFDPGQWDSDSPEELLIASKEGVYLFDDEASGAAQWTRITGDEAGGAGEVRQGRLPGGGRFIATVEPMHGNSVVIYTPPPAAQAGALWHRRVIDESIVDGHAVACGDALGAGSDQLVVGWRAMNRPAGTKVGIKLYTPLDAEGKAWRETLIDDNTMACEDLALADLDGDGDLDLAAAGRATKNVKIYFNQLIQ